MRVKLLLIAIFVILVLFFAYTYCQRKSFDRLPEVTVESRSPRLDVCIDNKPSAHQTEMSLALFVDSWGAICDLDDHTLTAQALTSTLRRLAENEGAVRVKLHIKEGFDTKITVLQLEHFVRRIIEAAVDGNVDNKTTITIYLSNR